MAAIGKILSFGRARLTRVTLLGAACIGMLFAFGIAPRPASAHVPSGPPTFTNPLHFTNLYHPFRPGAVKVFSGLKGGGISVIVDLYTHDTRTFTVNSVAVRTRVLQETEFLNGKLIEVSQNFYAQADDGTVYYFGELVNDYLGGGHVSHEGSWIVGGPTLPSDPPDAGNAPHPNVFMPKTPEVGDTWKPENLYPIVDETVRVLAIGRIVKVQAGTYDHVVQVRETTRLDTDKETKWYARGPGVIKGTTLSGETFMLIASTIP